MAVTGPESARVHDVAGARELVETALRDGYATLATVREIDLCVLAGAGAVVVDDQVWPRWMAFSDEQRSMMRWASIGVLCAGGLLRPRTGAYVPQPEDLLATVDAGVKLDMSQYDVAAELGTALQARQRPAFVVEGSATPQRADQWAPRLYGLADETQGTLTVVLEQVFAKSFGRFGHEVRFMLLSPAKASEVLISWLCVAPRTRWKPGQRAIRLITNAESGTDVRSWAATPTKDGWSLTRARSAGGGDVISGPVVNNAQSIGRFAGELADAMTGYVR